VPASIEPDDDNRLGEGDRASFTASDLRMVSWREFHLAGFKKAHSCFVTMESTNPRTHSRVEAPIRFSLRSPHQVYRCKKPPRCRAACCS